jgi:hypothetical protein
MLYTKEGPSIGKLPERSPQINSLMHLLFRNQAFYNIDSNVVSFFKNLSDEKALAFFNNQKIS